VKAGFAISAAIHAAFAFALFYQAPPASRPEAPRNAVKLFLPARRDVENSSAAEPMRNSPDFRLDRTARKSPKPKLDLAAVDLTIEDDTGRNMILVLKRYGGKIVVIDPATRAVEQAFWASNGNPVRGVSIAGGLPIILHQPEWWPETAGLKDRVPGDAWICALFPPDFIAVMGDAIQKRAAELGVADVHRATLSFTSSRPGLIIHEVG
jgi:hypothetical protein